MVPELLSGICGITGLNLWGRFSGLTGVVYIIGYVALVLAVTYALGKLHVRMKL